MHRSRDDAHCLIRLGMARHVGMASCLVGNSWNPYYCLRVFISPLFGEVNWNHWPNMHDLDFYTPEGEKEIARITRELRTTENLPSHNQICYQMHDYNSENAVNKYNAAYHDGLADQARKKIKAEQRNVKAVI